jgi:hypothetical protein
MGQEPEAFGVKIAKIAKYSLVGEIVDYVPPAVFRRPFVS